MTRRVSFETNAVNSAAGYLADDPQGLREALAAIDQLADKPSPDGSSPFGSPDTRRLRAGRYRVLYRISPDEITVIHLGRTSRQT